MNKKFERAIKPKRTTQKLYTIDSLTGRRVTMKVYGNRLCRCCHGLCHEGSWRTNAGIRKKYWCSEKCLREAMNKRLQKRCKAMGIWNWDGVHYSIVDLQNMQAELYEPIDVIAS